MANYDRESSFDRPITGTRQPLPGELPEEHVGPEQMLEEGEGQSPRRKAREAMGRVERMVEDHPWATMGAAIGAGAALGMTSRKVPGDPVGKVGALGGSLAMAIGGLLLRNAIAIGVRAMVEKQQAER